MRGAESGHQRGHHRRHEEPGFRLNIDRNTAIGQLGGRDRPDRRDDDRVEQLGRAAGTEALDPGNDGIAIRCIVDRDRCTNLERQKFIRNPSMPVQEYSSYCSRRSRRAPF
jgi:hypothetical protein